MKYKLKAFFSGRNGFDALSLTVLWASVILLIGSSFISIPWLYYVLYFIALAGFIYAYFRAMSRNLEKSQAENARLVNSVNLVKQRWKQRKTHKFYKCPKCRTVLRVPKGKGKIHITCRCCGERFIKKT